ncbi:hypothetical protein JF780_05595 [Mycobacterium intracellulare]|uniref:hypothetical protein n=1 Tax=Mycobacterium intracellulare TaxID=1767 RepID=UPI001CD9977B|nr:hypothetical protein [Mycobacterium intracellulare]MCA2275466.1 hypothetical protein [Mycobacterium intracellulare]MCA2324426.1 hypothetical protein [Mycobacterium intracellulare]
MSAAVTVVKTFSGICDRCAKPFRTPSFPNDCLCRACHLGALSPVDRAVALVAGAVS